MSWFFEKEGTSLRSSRNGAAVSAIGGFPPNFRLLYLVINLFAECVKQGLAAGYAQGYRTG
jgi:hypothetical protein